MVEAIVRTPSLGRRILCLTILTISSAPTIRESAAFDACTVSGVVLEKTTGQPLGGVEVVLIHEDRNIPERTVTNNQGEYVFSLVYPPGFYRLMASRTGYVTSEHRRLQVFINDTAIPVPPIGLEPTTGVCPRFAVLEVRSVTQRMSTILTMSQVHICSNATNQIKTCAPRSNVGRLWRTPNQGAAFRF